MKKLLILISLCASVTITNSAFGISLGDIITDNTIKAETTPATTMQLIKQNSDHSEYQIAKSSGRITVLVNTKGQVYGFEWSDKSPNLNSMLGVYKAEFDVAYAKRENKYNHRILTIDTPDLLVQQFGLPGGEMQGSMYAKDLQPAQ
ncbi:MAG: hypothetical protein QG673_252 [Pseudomonadota bacterium]|nr:hypothetical protein [Pseudomonadota bacterium]